MIEYGSVWIANSVGIHAKAARRGRVFHDLQLSSFSKNKGKRGVKPRVMIKALAMNINMLI